MHTVCAQSASDSAKEGGRIGGQAHSRSIGRADGRLVGGMDGRTVGQTVSRSGGQLVCRRHDGPFSFVSLSLTK